MKTLLFTLEYPPFFGGVASYYGNLVKYWPEPDDIFVLDNNKNGLISKNLPALKWLPSVWQLYSFVKKNKIDHILVGQILPLGISAWLIRKFTGVRYSVVLHGMDFTFALKSKRKKKIAHLILKNAQKIICGNSYVAKLVEEFFGDKSRILIVNPGIDGSAQFTKHNLQLKERFNLENKFILLGVGRLVKRKGFDMVLEALPEVLKQIPNLAYVIVGNGEEINNLKFKIKNLKLENNVIVITDVNNAEKNSWLEACDLFIMPSRNIAGDFEGFGIVYLEANLAGKPVIAGDSGGIRDAVVDGVNGLLVKPEDKRQISQAIVRLIENPELKRELGEKGRERALKDFNWKNQTEKIFKAIV